MALWRLITNSLARLWRVTRSRKLPYFIVAFIIYISVNTLVSRSQSDVIKLDEDLEVTSHSKITASKLVEIGPSGLQPQVKAELSSGVHEDENSAREELDGEAGGDRDAKQERAEDNAANEVNSVEPELHARKDIQNEDVLDKDAEESFHRMPADQMVSHFHNWRNLSPSEIKRLSVMGRRHYLQEDIGTPQNRNFTILTWLTGPSIARRLIRQYGKTELDPFRKCSVRNCHLTYDSSVVDKADAVLIHLHRTRGPHTFPNRTNFQQRWIFLSDESPYHTFMMAKDKNLAHYNGYFNWSMTYRMDSDIPVPYGRTIEMTKDEMSKYKKEDYFSAKKNFTAIMGSNCSGGNKRWTYVKELQKHMQVDVYGGCGPFKCPGHFTRDCPLMSSYKFYLAFENSNCREYITEKAWWNAFEKGGVPVVMGGRQEEYKKMLPPNSFIHIDDFESPEHLAKYLMYLEKDAVRYNAYHEWRSRYRVLNEHGYLGADVFHYCRICEALNYNDPAPKVYNALDSFWNRTSDCHQQTWVDRMNNAYNKTILL